MDDLREVIAASVGQSARFNKRHRCTRPEMPAAMCAQIAEDALAAIKAAGFVVVPAIPDGPMINAGAEEMQHHPAPTPIYLAMIEASNG